jgi:hypothetical protein
MGRPSCCKPTDEGTSIAAVAVLADGAFAYAKIGPAVARIWHLAVEAVEIFTLTAVAAAVTNVATCVTARVIRIRRQTRQQMLLQTVPPGTAHPLDGADSEVGCLACGDTGTVLRAITGRRYQQDRCPECQPAQGWVSGMPQSSPRNHRNNP